MKERRFLTRCNMEALHEIILEDGEARHLQTVLRLGPGNIVTVIDGHGRYVEARIVNLDPRKSRVLLTAVSSIRFKDDRLPIALLVALIKWERMAILVRQVTECGVHTILPVITDRTVVRPSRNKIERMKEIALQTLKQCGGLHAPDILPPVPLLQVEQALRQMKLRPATRLLLSPGNTAHPLVRSALETPLPWAVLIGPEGGLSDHEKRELKDMGFLETNLCPRTLRTETAATVTIGILSNCRELVTNGIRHHQVSLSEFQE